VGDQIGVIEAHVDAVKIVRDTRLTESASRVVVIAASNTVIVPAREAFQVDAQAGFRPAQSVHRGLSEALPGVVVLEESVVMCVFQFQRLRMDRPRTVQRVTRRPAVVG